MIQMGLDACIMVQMGLPNTVVISYLGGDGVFAAGSYQLERDVNFFLPALQLTTTFIFNLLSLLSPSDSETRRNIAGHL